MLIDHQLSVRKWLCSLVQRDSNWPTQLAARGPNAAQYQPHGAFRSYLLLCIKTHLVYLEVFSGCQWRLLPAKTENRHISQNIHNYYFNFQCRNHWPVSTYWDWSVILVQESKDRSTNAFKLRFSTYKKPFYFCFQVKVWSGALTPALVRGAGRTEVTPSDLAALSLAACPRKLKKSSCPTVGCISYK